MPGELVAEVAYDDGIGGDELWKSDGTTNGTVMVKDIRAGTLGTPPKRMAAR